MRRRVRSPEARRGSRAFAALMLALLCAAPTAGDIGGCGQEAVALDEAKFFAQKARIDCGRCQDCGLSTDTCVAACEGPSPSAAFPEGCLPLVHDGEVCLRALSDASCEEAARFVADRGATTPTECNFCPEEEER